MPIRYYFGPLYHKRKPANADKLSRVLLTGQCDVGGIVAI